MLVTARLEWSKKLETAARRWRLKRRVERRAGHPPRIQEERQPHACSMWPCTRSRMRLSDPVSWQQLIPLTLWPSDETITSDRALAIPLDALGPFSVCDV